MTKYLSIAAIAAALFACGLSAQTYLLNSDFNSGAGGWVITNASTAPATARQWTLSMGNYVTPTSGNIGTFDSTQFYLMDADTNGGTGVTIDTTATSPTFNGTTAPGTLTLQFAHNWSAWQNETATVEVFNGATWVQVVQYTTAQSVGQGVWNPSTVSFDITAHKAANNQVRLRYLDPASWGWFWAFDNVRVFYLTTPEIEVQRPAGAANTIPNNGTSSVGEATAATLVNYQWTVANTGGATLTHSVVIAASPAPVNCTIGSPSLAASTAASSSSTLTVPVTPTAAGAFSFRIVITNNDPDENPTNINVVGIVLAGSVLYYAGDPDLVDGTVNGRGFNVPNDVFVYEDFTVPAGQSWTLTQAYSLNFTDTPNAITGADYEIRTGVAAGIGGTLVSSGTNVAVAVSVTTFTAFGFTAYRVVAQFTTPVVLTSGTYFVGIRPVRSGLTGSSYCCTTSAASGVGTPLGNDLAFGNQTGTQFTGLAWEQLSDGGTPPVFFDYSVGVRGTSSSSPTLSVSTNTVTVPTTTAGTAGTATSFTVSGSNLTPASGSVTLALVSTPAGIEMRNATAVGTFGTGNITINYTSGAFAGQTIEVRFAASATATTYTGTITVSGGGATNQVVNLSGTVNAPGSPTLSVSTNTVTVPTTTAGTAGTATSFTVSGSNLTPASGSVTLALVSTPAGIEMRNATAVGTFGTGNITINYTSGAFAAQTIEVRFAASATATTYTGTVTVSGGGATNQVVNLSGTVNAPGSPTLSVSTNTVTVPTTTAGTAGTATSFTVSGSNLTPASGSVTLALVSTPAGIEMRNATAVGTFGTGNITINYTSGAFAAQTIEVRFAASATATTYTGTITVSGGGATNQVVNLSGTVTATGGALTIVTTTLPNGVVGTAYNATITAQNGTGPYTWSLASGTLPTGLTLNTAATGLTTSLSGTPTAAGVFTFTVQVADSASATDTQLYNVTVTSTGGGGGGLGGGGGGGGCSADSDVAPWLMLGAVLAMLAVALRRRAKA